jgi:hypothetical protein
VTERLHARLDVLPEAQRSLWPALRDLKTLGWVLYGGTAIALRLGHRSSVDFDFFNDTRLNRDRLAAVCPWLAESAVLQDRPDTLTVLTPAKGNEASGVKVSFFGGLDFGRVDVPAVTDDNVLLVASAHDLLAHKLKVLLQRVEVKDYLDVAALLGAGLNLDRGLASARALFGPAFQPSESLKALVYFEGGDIARLPPGIRQTLIAAVRAVGDLPRVPVVAQRLALQTESPGQD